MKPLKIRLQEARKKLGTIQWQTIERDYLLSWILAAISRKEIFQKTLVFKGGTALKKCYFGEYCFSEDLDFSGIPGCPTGVNMENAVNGVCTEAVSLLDEYVPLIIQSKRYEEKEPHPGGQEAFTIHAQFPWQRTPLTRIKIEISMDEKILKPVRKRRIIHEYGEPLDTEINTYALEEVVAEKLRAILQHEEKIKRRGWGRSRARDFYDLWRLFNAYSDKMDMVDFTVFLKKKCAIMDVDFSGPEDFFKNTILSHVDKTWEQWLGPLVKNLPSFNTVITELRQQVSALLKT